MPNKKKQRAARRDRQSLADAHAELFDWASSPKGVTAVNNMPSPNVPPSPEAMEAFRKMAEGVLQQAGAGLAHGQRTGAYAASMSPQYAKGLATTAIPPYLLSDLFGGPSATMSDRLQEEAGKILSDVSGHHREPMTSDQAAAAASQRNDGDMAVEALFGGRYRPPYQPGTY